MDILVVGEYPLLPECFHHPLKHPRALVAETEEGVAGRIPGTGLPGSLIPVQRQTVRRQLESRVPGVPAA
jgi:hypothetical protein